MPRGAANVARDVGIDTRPPSPYDATSFPSPPGGVTEGQPEETPVRAPKDDALRRLATIEGHLRGIRKMVEDDAYCVDVLKQTHAVQRAIAKFEQVLLRGHLSHCVPDGIRGGREHEVLGELEELFSLTRR